MRFEAQSEMKGIDTQPTGDAPIEQRQQNVEFVDEDEEPISVIKHKVEYLPMDMTPNIALGSFLSRPVLIWSKTWTENTYLDPAADFFLPWHLYFSKSSIQSKLNHYYMLRCNLHLKFVINASPFYYSAAIASYVPLQGFNTCPIAAKSTGDNMDIVGYSQRPHIYLYPQDSQGGEMILPFISYKNWLNATSSNDLQNFGLIDLKSFIPLQNANSVAGGNVEIAVYAWAEDVQLSVPTSSLSVQSEMKKKRRNRKSMNAKKMADERDEYQYDGVISGPASAVARAAGYLTGLPEVGAFATATSFAAGAVADIARNYGYTNVPVVDDVHGYKPSPYPHFATTEIGTPIEKLTVDPKNELTVDPKVCGADVGDELTMTSLTQRECFVYDFPWASTSAINANLMGAKVNPGFQQRTSTGTNQTLVQQGPLAFLARCFSYWRGDIIYRFKFLCTKYHKGRVKISWDPYVNVTTSATDYTTETYTRIVDISQETDVEIRVPFGQTYGFLQTQPSNIGNGFGTTVGSTSLDSSNGYITMKVLNRQTSPVSSADIRVLVFMRGASNFEFAAPGKIPREISPYSVQSEMKRYDEPEEEEKPLSGEPNPTDPHVNLVYFGETISSMRQLIRRFSKYVRINYLQDEIDAYTMYDYHTKLPRNNLFPGFDPDGIHIVTGINSLVNEDYNYVHWTYMSWMQQAFIGRTGSINYSVIPQSGQEPSTIGNITVARSLESRTQADFRVTINGNTDARVSQFCADRAVSGTEGMSCTHYHSLTGPTASLPMYSRCKFQANIASSNHLGIADDDSDLDTLKIEHTSSRTNATHDYLCTYDLYTAAGTDFNLIFYLNIPTMYWYSATPTWVSQH